LNNINFTHLVCVRFVPTCLFVKILPQNYYRSADYTAVGLLL